MLCLRLCDKKNYSRIESRCLSFRANILYYNLDPVKMQNDEVSDKRKGGE